MTINIFTTRTPEGNYLPNKGELMELIQKTMFPGEEEFSFLQNAPTEDILNLDDISAAVSDAVERLGPKALMIWAELLNQRSY